MGMGIFTKASTEEETGKRKRDDEKSVLLLFNGLDSAAGGDRVG